MGWLTQEKCDRYCGRMAELRVVDRWGHEIDVCCRECASSYLPAFEDAEGNALFPEALGQFLRNMLNPGPEPVPPYVWMMETDENGKLLLRLLNPDED